MKSIRVDEDFSEAQETTDAVPVRPSQLPQKGRWKVWLYALVCGLVILFGAGGAIWSMGLATLLIGLVLVVAPPRWRLPFLPSLALLVLALVPGVCLLPVAWLGGMSDWRARLIESWSLPIPSTLSAMPEVVVESWCVLLVCLLWLIACLGQRFPEAGRRTMLRLLALGGAGIAVLSIMEHLGWFYIHWWPDVDDRFGPFANRNHSSSLAAISGVLCMAAGYDAFRRKKKLWMLFAVAFLAPLSAIFLNTSRGGLLIFLLGALVWLLTVGVRRGKSKQMAISAALVLLVMSIVIASGGRLGERLLSDSSTGKVSGAFRLRLAVETLQASTGALWTGWGLGTFDTLFPQIISTHLPETRLLHPESDVVWALFEGGLLQVLPVCVLVFWWIRATGPWTSASSYEEQRSRSGHRIRRAFAIAAGMSLLHSVFDVPNHVPGYFMITALLIALAVRPRRLNDPMRSLPRLGFRASGFALSALGIGGMLIHAGTWQPPVSSVSIRLRERALQQAQAGEPAAAMRTLQRSLSISPMDYRSYYQRAELKIILSRSSESALIDFGRVRALEPRFAPVCFNEGTFWLNCFPELAIIPWRECKNRFAPGDTAFHHIYQDMLTASRAYPEVRQSLWRMADDVFLQWMFLFQAVSTEEWEASLAEFLEQHPQLNGVEQPVLGWLIAGWDHKGDRAALVKLLESQSRLREAGWRVLAQEQARQGHYQAAYEIAVRHIKSPRRTAALTAADIPRLERAFLFNPTDPLPGIELYYAYLAASNYKAAAQTLTKIAQLANAPRFISYEQATLSARLGDYRQAWELMEQAQNEVP